MFGWLKTNALIVALGALAITGPAAVLMFYWWQDARDEARALAARVEQIVEAEERADQARADLAEVQTELDAIQQFVEGQEDAPVPDWFTDAFSGLFNASGAAHP